ncbi:sulfur carrier protein ThiS [Haliovirga abyssi]|uniref:Thiamine biosynthesis protein ThiS n=1 Tax=Haliovirga abyssi TaxID=2996794 RepID=A0AAU9DNA8_9FUSO|nr:sulfur carrier protein ThiS [Haliovirga abyssi]BDU51552.1 thiamine biosynthesis protein ThiS [Haliovirga abyssi]
MEIVINGEKRLLLEEISVENLIFLLKLNKNSILVELNLEIIKKYEWENTIISEGDSVEIITFMGGG